ncbi:MAG: tetratricopeptide repeat protein [Armatimonadota bacterium]
MNQESGAALREEGARLLQSGNLTQAVEKLQQAIAANPDDVGAHGLLGICHGRRGDLVSAVASLQQAAFLQPDHAGARYNLAVALYQARRMDEATAELTRTLELDPAHAAAKKLLERIGTPVPASA